MRRRALLSDGSIDYSQKYFTMVVTVGGNIMWSSRVTNSTLSYSKNNGATWTTINSETTVSVNAGDKVLWKTTPDSAVFTAGSFSGDANVRYSVEGNVMSLVYGDNFKLQTSLSGKYNVFSGLFEDNTNVTSAENLSLPATTLADGCYLQMFNRCTNLTTAPQLPATTLAYECYYYMFGNCTSLVIAPELPATILGDECYYCMFSGCTSLTTAPSVLPATTLTVDCYNGMFSGCTSLTTAPVLSATTLADECCYGMFYGCTSLTTAPSLPATTLSSGCYWNMFRGCTSLTTAPELPATTLANYCYSNMFRGCTSLTTAPKLPATTLANECYYTMFRGCTSLTTAPELPATTLANYCYSNMFRGCTSLNSITCLATDISATECTDNWVSGVAATGTFTKAADMTSWTTGANGIPSGWTVENRVEPVVLYPEDYDTPVSGYINSTGNWAKAQSSGRQTWVFHDITNYQGGTCNLYLGSVTGYYAFVKQIPTAVGSVQYASGWSNRATLSQDAIGIQIPSDAVYLCFYYHGSPGNMYPSRVEIYPQE